MPVVQRITIPVVNPDNEENDAENDQGRLLACDSHRLGREQKNGLDVRKLKPRWLRSCLRGSGSARLPQTGGLLHFPVFLVAALVLAGPDVPRPAPGPCSRMAVTRANRSAGRFTVTVAGP
jgi:hypothetical protein